MLLLLLLLLLDEERLFTGVHELRLLLRLVVPVTARPLLVEVLLPELFHARPVLLPRLKARLLVPATVLLPL